MWWGDNLKIVSSPPSLYNNVISPFLINGGKCFLGLKFEPS